MLKRSEYERNEILRIAKYDFSSKDFASMPKWRNHHMIATNTTADFDRLQARRSNSKKRSIMDTCKVRRYKSKPHAKISNTTKSFMRLYMAKIRQIISKINLIWNYFALFIRKAIVLRINKQGAKTHLHPRILSDFHHKQLQERSECCENIDFDRRK